MSMKRLYSPMNFLTNIKFVCCMRQYAINTKVENGNTHSSFKLYGMRHQMMMTGCLSWILLTLMLVDQNRSRLLPVVSDNYQHG